MAEIFLSPVIEADLPRLAEISIDARVGNPLSAARWPGFGNMSPEAQHKHTLDRIAYGYSRNTSIYLKPTLGNGTDIVGFAVWDDPLNIRKHPLEHLDTITYDEYMQGADEVLADSLVQSHAIGVAEAPTPHLYLSNINVAKEAQGKEVGSKLLQWGLDLADERQWPIYAISSEELSDATFLDWVQAVRETRIQDPAMARASNELGRNVQGEIIVAGSADKEGIVPRYG